MRIIGSAEVLKISNKFFGQSWKSYRALAAEYDVAKAELLRTWQDSLDSAGGPSKGPAYHVYHDPRYVLEAIHCFKKSKTGALKAVQYFAGDTAADDGSTFNGELTSLRILDLYNGCGLTTAMLAVNDVPVQTFNDCESQVQYMTTALEVLGCKPVLNHSTRPTEKFDVVLSFEVFEHYTDPLIHLKEIIDLLEPGGYLVESSGFNGSSENIGHFDSYPMLGWLMPYVKARQILTKIMLQFFDLVQSNFNTNPRIWRRNSVPFTPFTPRMAASACWDMFPKQYGFNSQVFALIDGEVHVANGDRILESADARRQTKGLSSLFDGTAQVYRCNEGWDDLFVKLEC